MILVKILGMGDARHKALGRNMVEALLRQHIDARLIHIMDVDEILAHRVATIPAVVIGDQIIFQDTHIPDSDELIDRLQKLFSPSNQDAA